MSGTTEAYFETSRCVIFPFFLHCCLNIFLAHCYLHFLETLVATFFKKFPSVAPRCSGYHYCTTSFSKTWTEVLRRFKSCLQRIRDSCWWGSLRMVPAGNNAKRLSSVNHTTKKTKQNKKRINSILLKDIASLAVKFNVCNKLNYILPSLWEPYHWTVSQTVILHTVM